MIMNFLIVLLAAAQWEKIQYFVLKTPFFELDFSLRLKIFQYLKSIFEIEDFDLNSSTIF